MAEFSGTPGPWEVMPGNDGWVWAYHGRIVAHTGSKPHQLADAYLISASPCLLAACERMVAALERIADGGLLLPPYAAALDAGRHALSKVLALERDDAGDDVTG